MFVTGMQLTSDIDNCWRFDSDSTLLLHRTDSYTDQIPEEPPSRRSIANICCCMLMCSYGDTLPQLLRALHARCCIPCSGYFTLHSRSIWRTFRNPKVFVFVYVSHMDNHICCQGLFSGVFPSSCMAYIESYELVLLVYCSILYNFLGVCGREHIYTLPQFWVGCIAMLFYPRALENDAETHCCCYGCGHPNRYHE